MNKAILNTANQEFINNTLDSDVHNILLKKQVFKDVTIKELVEQIEAKKRCKIKLPTWFNSKNIYYPNKLNIEQTSSETTASYKSDIISGKSILDLTGGFGIDSYFFSQSFKAVTHCEVDKHLSDIASHNFKQLKVAIETIHGDGLAYLKENNKPYDWIYADPSRRHDSKGKVFFLKDCLPNIPKRLELLFNYTSNILLKVSPMLDISHGISELEHVKAIHVIAVNNEVKELLYHLEYGFNETISINTVNFSKENIQKFDFNREDEQHSDAIYSLPKQYLYEPNAAILKSGAFKLVSEKLNICKLHQHSHLYTSEELINFPGRSFKIIDTLAFNKKAVKKLFANKKASLSIRNFPDSVAHLKKKFNIKDGGTDYIFFTTNCQNDKIVIVTEKV